MFSNPKDGAPFLYRWRLNTETGEFSKTRLSDDPIEFPRIADDRVGLPSTPLDTPLFSIMRRLISSTLVLFANSIWSRVSRKHSPLTATPFAVNPFLLLAKVAEDDGYVLLYVNDELNDTSRLCVFDATSLSAGPVAEVHVPHRVPQGCTAVGLIRMSSSVSRGRL